MFRGRLEEPFCMSWSLPCFEPSGLLGQGLSTVPCRSISLLLLPLCTGWELGIHHKARGPWLCLPCVWASCPDSGPGPWSVRCRISICKMLMLLSQPPGSLRSAGGDRTCKCAGDQMLQKCRELLLDHREVGWEMFLHYQKVFQSLCLLISSSK